MMPAWVAIAIVLTLVIVTIVLLVLWNGKVQKDKAADAGSAASAPGEIAPPAEIKIAIAIAMHELRIRVAGGRGPTDVPWVLVVGADRERLAPLLPPPLPEPNQTRWVGNKRLANAGTLSFHSGGVILSFADGLVGKPLAPHRLSALLNAVAVVRPNRAIDALVIVLRAPELAQPVDDAGRAALATLGQQLYEILLKVQRQIGWRVPVHVLISQCDELAGFGAYAAETSAQTPTPTIGWAVSQGIDSVFAPHWIDSAFEAMRSTVLVQQMHLLMSSVASCEKDEVVAFPERLEDLRPGLAIVLGQMMQSSAYHEGFMLRGIFLTGAPAVPPVVEVDEQAIVLVPATVVSQSLAQTLFSSKIFAEAGLAQPAYGELTRRHRMVRRAKHAMFATALLFAIGLAAIQWSSRNYLPPVTGLLEDILRIERDAGTQMPRYANGHIAKCQDDHDIDRAQGNYDPAAYAAFPLTDLSPRTSLNQSTLAEQRRIRLASLQLLNQMSQIRIGNVYTIFAPTSLLASTNRDIKAAIRQSFNTVIFTAISNSMATPEGINTLVDVPEIVGYKSYWNQTIDKFVAYNSNYLLAKSLANKSATDPSLVTGFDKLVRYSLAEALPSSFTSDFQLYSTGIAGLTVPCIDSTMARGEIARQVDLRYGRAFALQYDESALADEVLPIAARFTPAMGMDEAGSSPDAALHWLVADIDRIRSETAQSVSYDWVFTPAGMPMPLPDTQRLANLQVIDANQIGILSNIYGPKAVAVATAMQNARLFDVAILAPDPKSIRLGKPQLSDGLADTYNLVRALFAQSFMASATPDPTSLAMPIGNVSWNIDILRQAQQASQDYVAFSDRPPGPAPEDIRRIVALAARQHLEYWSERLLASAARPAVYATNPMAATDPESANFTAALPLLIGIRNSLRQAGFDRVATALDVRVASQASRLLAQADRQLAAAAGPYAVVNESLSRWDGAGSLAAAAFDVPGIDDVKASLPWRADRVATIANTMAKPLLSYLRDPGTSTPASAAISVRRWQGIIDALALQAAGNADNGLSRLEQFIGTDIDRLGFGNCALLSANPRGAGRDWFAQQQAQIGAHLAARCRFASAQGAEAQYRMLRRDFSSSLAGRFPFSQDAGAPPANPDDVQRFFAEYGAQLPALKTAIEADEAYGPSRHAAAATLGQLIRAASALSSMLGDPPQALNYRVDVHFFTDPVIERGQNQVIAASIGTPVSRAVMPGAIGNFIWSNGQPVSVGLRWAANAPTIPTPPAGACILRPGGNTVGFRFQGDWALLRLLRVQAPLPEEARTDSTGTPIALAVDLCANRRSASGGDQVMPSARVFLRVALTAALSVPDKPDRQVPIVMPAFPYGVPALMRSEQR